MKRMRAMALLLTAAFCSSMVLSAAAAGTVSGRENGIFGSIGQTLFDETEYHDSGSMSMPKLSVEELQQLMAENPTKLQGDVYDETPSCEAPYATGKVKQEVLQQAADRLNLLRRIAGLPAAELTSGLSENAQYGAVILTKIGKNTHTPDRPGDMSRKFYQEAYSATSSSCLAHMGTNYTGLHPEKKTLDGPAYAVDKLMGDMLVPSLGHRRWLLSPRMGKTGIGYVGSITLTGNYTARVEEYTLIKVQDRSASCNDYNFIAWPASGNFPASLSGAVWSISLNPQKFQQSKSGSVTITVTRQSDGKVWHLDKLGGEDGSLIVDNQTTDDYLGCLIFRPQDVLKDSPDNLCHGLYTVRVDGLVSASGRSVNTFEYQVNFVDA